MVAARAAPDAVFLSRAEADLSDPAACAAAIRRHADGADAVINAAAWTAVDRAESEEDAAHAVNADAPGAMATACAARGLPFLHISTDYVFDGSGTAPWRESDSVAPLGAYGLTKLGGERAVAAAMEGTGVPHAILRTSWVVSAHSANFVKTMLRLGAERDELSVVDDQVGAPTPAADLAAALLRMAERIITVLRASYRNSVYVGPLLFIEYALDEIWKINSSQLTSNRQQLILILQRGLLFSGDSPMTPQQDRNLARRFGPALLRKACLGFTSRL